MKYLVILAVGFSLGFWLYRQVDVEYKDYPEYRSRVVRCVSDIDGNAPCNGLKVKKVVENPRTRLKAVYNPQPALRVSSQQFYPLIPFSGVVNGQ
jgi:hypothetical protein